MAVVGIDKRPLTGSGRRYGNFVIVVAHTLQPDLVAMVTGRYIVFPIVDDRPRTIFCIFLDLARSPLSPSQSIAPRRMGSVQFTCYCCGRM